jgi:hypothetical protein
MPSIQISVETLNAATGVSAGLFNPFSPNLRLVINYVLSPDLASMPNLTIETVFQLINLHTNEVFFNNPGQHPVPAGQASGASYYDINPSNTAGMQWATGADIFGFRGAVAALESNGSYVDAIAVSDVRWFRLEDVATL